MSNIVWLRKGRHYVGIWEGVVRFDIAPNPYPEDDALAGRPLPFILRDSLKRGMSRHPSVEDAKSHADRRA